MSATTVALADLGPCDYCSHPQWRHKRGKGGCAHPECGGICDKYTPPKARPTPPADDWPLPAVEVEDAEAAGLVVRAESPASEAGVPMSVKAAQAASDRLVAAADRVLGEPAAPQPVDEPAAAAEPVVVDPAAQAEYTRQVAAIDAQLAAPDDDRRPCSRCGDLVLTLSSDDRCDSCVAEAAAIERPTGERDAVLAQAVAVAEALAAERDEARRERDRLQSRLDIIRQERRREHLAHQVLTLTAERDQAVLQRDQAYERVDEQATELGRIHAALGIESDADAVEVVEQLAAERDRYRDHSVTLNAVAWRIASALGDVPAGAEQISGDPIEQADRLVAERDKACGAAEDAQRRAEHLAGEVESTQAANDRLAADLAAVNARQARTRRALDDAIRTGAAAAARVMWRYDAWQCESCGFRTTVPDLDHEHPLTPVMVLIVQRDQAEATAPADTNTSKEN